MQSCTRLRKHDRRKAMPVQPIWPQRLQMHPHSREVLQAVTRNAMVELTAIQHSMM